MAAGEHVGKKRANSLSDLVAVPMVMELMKNEATDVACGWAIDDASDHGLKGGHAHPLRHQGHSRNEGCSRRGSCCIKEWWFYFMVPTYYMPL